MSPEVGSDQVWGLVSDIHGNYPALEEALRVLSQAGARRMAFLGDYLGRGDNDRCVRRIREVADATVVGNRDLDWQTRVSPVSGAWVRGLPRSVSVGSLLLTHGDARLTPDLSTSEINRDFLRAWASMQQAGASVWAFGHSHHARLWCKASLSARAQPLGVDALDGIPIHADQRYFLNVGTTGLPFPGKGGPSVALVDCVREQIRYLALDVHGIGSE